MSDAPVLIAGVKIEATRKRIAGRDPATVTLHKVGSDGMVWLTPDEADRIADALHDAATYARGNP